MAIVWIALAVVLGLGAIGGTAFWFISGRAPSCAAPSGGDAAKQAEAGAKCVQFALRSGDQQRLTQGVDLLNQAKGSGLAALELAKLYDPALRAKQKRSANLTPGPDRKTSQRMYAVAQSQGRTEKIIAEALSRFIAEDGKAPVMTTVALGRPRPMPQAPSLYQRVLTLPGAKLYERADPASPEVRPVNVFDVLYVFGVQPGWIQVGRSIDKPEGWLQQHATQDWSVMLVMDYAQLGQRNPVLFFTDQLSAKSVLASPDPEAAARKLYDSINTPYPDPRLVSVEQAAVDAQKRPYLMPILDVATAEAASGEVVRLVQVASVRSTAEASVAPQLFGPVVEEQRAPPSTATASDLRHAISFAIDTTSSMGPYIDVAKRFATEVQEKLSSDGTLDKVRFGLMGFRNNIEDRPQVEYVTKPYLTLSQAADANALAAALQSMTPTPHPTHSFSEDSVAGLYEAIGWDWSGFNGVKILFLITDAGALSGDDPRARYKDVGLDQVRNLAAKKGIVVIPVHLQTPEARSANNVELARGQYQRLLDVQGTKGTGDLALSKYVAIPSGDPAAFENALDSVMPALTAIQGELQGQFLSKPEITGTQATLEQVIVNELFAAQQRFLGAASGADAPSFRASWTSDHDLARPKIPALQVKVFLTRRQLSELAAQVDRVIQTAERAEVDSDRFFSMLQMIAASSATDPSRSDLGRNVDTLGDILPQFLTVLPYKSDILNLDADRWRQMGRSGQNTVISELKRKLRIYGDFNKNQGMWQSLGDRDAYEAVTLVSLDDLP